MATGPLAAIQTEMHSLAFWSSEIYKGSHWTQIEGSSGWFLLGVPGENPFLPVPASRNILHPSTLAFPSSIFKGSKGEWSLCCITPLWLTPPASLYKQPVIIGPSRTTQALLALLSSAMLRNLLSPLPHKETHSQALELGNRRPLFLRPQGETPRDIW